MNFKFLKRREVKIFLIIWIIYIFFMTQYGGNYMAEAMLGTTMSMVDKGSFTTDDYMKESCKESGCDYAFNKGYFYSGFPPGASFLAVPVYVIFKPLFWLLPNSFMGIEAAQLKMILMNILATVFIASLLSALTSVILYKFLRYFVKNKKWRLFITFAFAFGTLFFLYSTSYDKKVIATFFLFYSFYLLFKMKRKNVINSKKLFLVGLMCGFATTVDSLQYIIAGLLFLYLLTFVKNKKIFWFILGGILAVIPMLIYNYICFGNILATPYKFRAASKVISKMKGSFLFFVKPTWLKAWYLSFSPYRGIFFYIPIFFLSIIGLIYGFFKKFRLTENILIVTIFLSYFVALCSIAGLLEVGGLGCSFGQRNILPMIPFMILPIGFVINKIKPLIIYIVTGISIFINSLGAQYDIFAIWTPLACTDKNIVFNHYLPILFSRGISTYTFNLINKIIKPLSILTINLLTLSGLVVIGLIIWLIWKR